MSLEAETRGEKRKKPTKERKREGNKYTEVIVLIAVDMWLLW